MKKFGVSHHDDEDRSAKEFSMEQPVLPEDRRKTSGWTLKEYNIPILDTDIYYMGA